MGYSLADLAADAEGLIEALNLQLSVGRRSQLGISRGSRRTAMQGCLRAFDDELMTIAMQY